MHAKIKTFYLTQNRHVSHATVDHILIVKFNPLLFLGLFNSYRLYIYIYIHKHNRLTYNILQVRKHINTSINMGAVDTMLESYGNEFFTRHTDSVLCCSVDGRCRLAVTGGIDDTAFVWDLKTKHVIFECLGHRESVVAASFSVNSTYVATGDLNGYIQVRNTTTGIKIFDFDVDEINWILWHNTSEFVLLAGTTKGEFWMWNVNDPAAVKTFPSYGSPTTVAKLLSDGFKIVSGYGDGSVRVFDLKTRQTVLQLNDPNQAEVISLDLNLNNALLAVGCIDSSVKLINLNTCKVVGNLFCKSPEQPTDGSTSGAVKSNEELIGSEGAPADGVLDGEDVKDCDAAKVEPLEIIDEFARPPYVKDDVCEDSEEAEEEDDFSEDESNATDIVSVESVLFSRCGRYLAAANNLGTICIWDVAFQVVRCQRHTNVGITRCAWSDNGNYITSCLDGTVVVYDLNLAILKRYELHSDQILDIHYRNKVLVSASEDKTCRVISVAE